MAIARFGKADPSISSSLFRRDGIRLLDGVDEAVERSVGACHRDGEADARVSIIATLPSSRPSIVVIERLKMAIA
jgi:hypothetical protein